MNLERAIPTVLSEIPARLKNMICIASACALNNLEALAAQNVLFALDRAIFADSSVALESRITLIFTASDTISLSLADHNSLGKQVNLAIFPVHRWRSRSLSVMQMETCIAEELCHYFWNIRDENLVQHHVFEIIQRIHPNAQLSDVYNPNWKPDAG